MGPSHGENDLAATKKTGLTTICVILRSKAAKLQQKRRINILESDDDAEEGEEHAARHGNMQGSGGAPPASAKKARTQAAPDSPSPCLPSGSPRPTPEGSKVASPAPQGSKVAEQIAKVRRLPFRPFFEQWGKTSTSCA